MLNTQRPPCPVSQHHQECVCATRARPARRLVCTAASERDQSRLPRTVTGGLLPAAAMLAVAAGAVLMPMVLPEAAHARRVERVLTPFQRQQQEAQEMANIIRRRRGETPSVPAVLDTPSPSRATPASMSSVRERAVQAEAMASAPPLAAEPPSPPDTSAMRYEPAAPPVPLDSPSSFWNSAPEAESPGPRAARAEIASGTGRQQAVASTEGKSAGPMAMFDGLGFLSGGIMAGYALLLRKSNQAAQGALSSLISNEQRVVADLRSQAEKVRSMLEGEQTLVQSLRAEMATASENSARLLELERREKAAGVRSAELVTKSLEAEKRYVEAVRREAAAALEQVESERAAKFVAEAEAREVARQLAVAQEQREQDAELARKNNEAALAARKTAEAAQGALGEAVVSAQSLRVQLTAEQVRAQEAEAAAAELKLREELAQEKIREQEGRIVQVGREALDLRGAMGTLKQQALEIQARSQAGAEAATLERSQLQQQLDLVNEQLDEERGMVAVARGEIRLLKASLMETSQTTQRLEMELGDSRRNTERLVDQLRDLQLQADATGKLLVGERTATVELRQVAAGLSTELQEVYALLTRTVDDVAAERAGRQALTLELTTAKAEYLAIASQLEEEQGRTAQLRREAEDLQRQIREVQLEGQQMLQAQQADAQAELQALQQAREQADKEASKIRFELVVARKQLQEAQADRAADAASFRQNEDGLRQVADEAQRRVQELQAAADAEDARVLALVGNGDRLQEQEKVLTDRLVTVQAALEQAEQDVARNREESSLAARKLQAVRADADAAQEAAQVNAAALEQERAARQAAEENLARLRSKLDGLAAQQEAAKKDMEGQLATMRSDFAQMRSRKAAKGAAAAAASASDSDPATPASAPGVGVNATLAAAKASASAAIQARMVRAGMVRAGAGSGPSVVADGSSAGEGEAAAPAARETVEAKSQ